MSIRLSALTLASAIILTACSDQSPPTSPRATVLKSSLSIDAGTFCTGATMPVAECAALVTLYNTTNGPAWESKSGWGVNPNPCLWQFVDCTAGDHGSVSALNLGGNNLSGPIPAALGALTQATTIKLYNNHLSGSIPAALGGLASVEFLYLSKNELTGPIPPELGALTTLKWLVLNENPLGGSIPASLGNLTSLERLYLYSAQLTGSIPASLGNLANLEVLWLGNNALSGTIPPALGNLANLEDLNLVVNGLSGPIPPELGNLASLTNLWLSGNQLSGSIPPALGNLGALEFLDLTVNALTGPIPEALAQLSNLKWLHLYENQLSGVMPLAVAALAESPGVGCLVVPGNAEVYLPDLPAYRAVDAFSDGHICGVFFSSAEDIGEDAIDDIDELVPDVLNEGQANALKTKIENAMAKAANGQYGAAINQMQAFVAQLNEMVAGGTLTPAQATPLIQEAESLIAIWTGML